MTSLPSRAYSSDKSAIFAIRLVRAVLSVFFVSCSTLFPLAISHNNYNNNNHNYHLQPQELFAPPSSSSSSSSSDEWDVTSFRSETYGNGFTCVNIPLNFTLCKNIGYSNMMIPNLLGHDSLQEAEYHAKSWIPLLGLQCHPDTQLFLCSLFSPICLDRPIFPCRSLCQGVQAKCEPRMLAYNYPWPSMLKCEQFPEDHDLCIKPGAANNTEEQIEQECPSCNQARTCENIVDNYCRADFVFRAKFKGNVNHKVEFRKGRFFKSKERRRKLRDLRMLSLDAKDSCCLGKLRPGHPYFIMGVIKGDQRIVTFVMAWSGKDKILKSAVRTFRSMDCSNPLPMSVMAEGQEPKRGKRNNGTRSIGSSRRKKRRRKHSQQKKNNNKKFSGCRVSLSPSTKTKVVTSSSGKNQ